MYICKRYLYFQFDLEPLLYPLADRARYPLEAKTRTWCTSGRPPARPLYYIHTYIQGTTIHTYRNTYIHTESPFMVHFREATRQAPASPLYCYYDY